MIWFEYARKQEYADGTNDQQRRRLSIQYKQGLKADTRNDLIRFTADNCDHSSKCYQSDTRLERHGSIAENGYRTSKIWLINIFEV